MRQRVIIIICILSWGVSIVFGALQYDTNDDAIRNLIAAGAYGEASQFLIYSNFMLGYLIKMLYVLFPQINCYLWFFLIMNLWAAITLCFLFSKGRSVQTTILITVVINVLLANDFYIRLQYTKNATLYGITGMLLLLQQIEGAKREERRGTTPASLVSIFFLWAGWCTRAMGFAILIPFGLNAIVFLLWRQPVNKKIFLFLSMAVMICVCSFGIQRGFYKKNPEWDYYRQWNDIMTSKRDHGNYHFSWDEEEYLEAGFTETDFVLMSFWYWNDPDYFTLDRLKTMQEIGRDHRRDRIRFDTDTIIRAGKEMTGSIAGDYLAWIFVVCLAVGVVMFSWRSRLFMLLQMLFVYAEHYYLACGWRTIDHVTKGIWLSALLLGLWVCREEFSLWMQSGKPKTKYFLIVVSALALCIHFTQVIYEDYNAKGRRIVQEADGTYSVINGIRGLDGYYVLSVDNAFGGLGGANNIFDIDYSYLDYFRNMIPIGGWIIPSPIGMYHSHRAGIENPMKALFERDDVYYVGGGERMGWVLVWLQEKYDPAIYVEHVGEVNGQMIWKYRLDT